MFSLFAVLFSYTNIVFSSAVVSVPLPTSLNCEMFVYYVMEITRYPSLLWRFTDYFIQSLHANWDKHVWGRNILARQAFLSIIHVAAWKLD